MFPKKLNLGCGCTPLVDWINLDRIKLPGVDVVYNIENLPLPFGDEEIDEILCNNIIEHIEYIPVLADLYRILKQGGILTIKVPHFTSRDNYVDPTHIKRFSIRTFDFFVKESNYGIDYYFNFKFNKMDLAKLIFLKKFPLLYNYLIEYFVNINLRIVDFYELSFLSGLFPAQYLLFRLIK